MFKVSWATKKVTHISSIFLILISLVWAAFEAVIMLYRTMYSTFSITSLLAGFIFLSLWNEAELAPADNVGAKYTTRYDHIDVNAILNSRRLLKNYMECVLERGPCTKEGIVLKEHLPDALQTECAKCSERQKVWAGKVMAHLLQYQRDYWILFVDKYDKDGNFRKKFGYKDDNEADEDDDTEGDY